MCERHWTAEGTKYYRQTDDWIEILTEDWNKNRSPE